MDNNRRQFLLYALATGAAFALPGCAGRSMIRAMPEPTEMPDYMSVFQYMGEVTLNGRKLGIESKIRPGDLIETGPDSQMVFVLEKDAFQLEANSRLQLPNQMEGGTYALQKGAALGVFASRRVNISTPDAVIGIRGTGVYAEVQEQRSYICTCYGETLITASADTSQRVSIVSKHHDAPKYVYGSRLDGVLIEAAPFINHADKELSMIEALVGRSMPLSKE